MGQKLLSLVMSTTLILLLFFVFWASIHTTVFAAVDGQGYPITYQISGGTVNNITADKEQAVYF
jgi:hypothetical protein